MGTQNDRNGTAARGARLFAATLLLLMALLAAALAPARAAFAAPVLEEYAGENRYETSALTVEAAFPDGVESGWAVLVSGENAAWPDALSAASLAGAVEGPVLITQGSTLTQATAELIEELDITNVIIVGGTSAVDEAVEEALTGLGVEVTRLAGATRYETQCAVYTYGAEQGYWGSTVFVATGTSYADALAASAVAYSQKIPIFLANAQGGFTDNQASALFDGSITRVIILGGTSAVPAVTANYCKAVTMVNSLAQGGSGTVSVKRLSGDTRYETSLAIAEWAVSSGYASWDNAAFASGTSPADALSGSSLQGRSGSIILLVSDEADCATIQGLGEQATSLTTSVRIFGGTSAVSTSVRAAIMAATGAVEAAPEEETEGTEGDAGSGDGTEDGTDAGNGGDAEEEDAGTEDGTDSENDESAEDDSDTENSTDTDAEQEGGAEQDGTADDTDTDDEGESGDSSEGNASEEDAVA